MGNFCLKNNNFQEENKPKYLNCNDNYRGGDHENIGFFPKYSPKKNWKEQLIIQCNDLIEEYKWAVGIKNELIKVSKLANKVYIGEIQQLLDLENRPKKIADPAEFLSFDFEVSEIADNYHNNRERSQMFSKSKILEQSREINRNKAGVSFLNPYKEMLSCIQRKSIISRNTWKDFCSFVQKPEKMKFKNNDILNKESYQNLRGQRFDMYNENEQKAICFKKILFFFKIFLEYEFRKYKLITETIERHILQCTAHPLYHLRQSYINYFIQTYSKYLKPKISNDIEAMLKQLIEDLLEFLFLLVDSIMKFYNIKLFPQDTNEKNNIRWLVQRLYSPCNFYNFCLCLLFESPKVYEICFELQKQFDKRNSKKDQELQIEKIRSLSPQEFGVAPHFCLNEKSIELMFKELDFDLDIDQIEMQTGTPRRYSFHEFKNQQNDQQTIDTNHNNLIANSQRTNSFLFNQKPDNTLSILNNAENKKNSVNQIYMTIFNNKNSENYNQMQILLNRVPEQPYESAINLMKKIENLQSPLHKLQLLQRVGQEIFNCIFQFYHLIQLEQSFEVSNQDMIFIFLYVLVQSNVNSLHSHFNLIENFINSDDLEINSSSMFSYFTVRSCLDYIDGISAEKTNEQSYIHFD